MYRYDASECAYDTSSANAFIDTRCRAANSTGKERDAESGLDDFDARYYSSSLGRFVTPDWAAKPTAVPYAEFGNPQSLNLYGYVHNNRGWPSRCGGDANGGCPTRASGRPE